MACRECWPLGVAMTMPSSSSSRSCSRLATVRGGDCMAVSAAWTARPADSGAASAMHATSAAPACTTARIRLSPIQPTPRNPRRGGRVEGCNRVAVVLTSQPSCTLDQRLHESRRAPRQRFERRTRLLQGKAVGPQRLGIEITARHQFHRLLHAAAIHRRLALVRVDDVQAAPVPLLQVDLSRTVLVIAGENQARTYASELGGDVQRLLNPGRLDDAMAAASAGNRSGLCDRARAV